MEHLAALKTRTLVGPAVRDAMGNREAVEGYFLSPSIEVFWLAAGDHDFKPLKASGFIESVKVMLPDSPSSRASSLPQGFEPNQKSLWERACSRWGHNSLHTTSLKK